MKQNFKFRHADEIAGTFVIIAAILFVVAVIMAGRAQGWFDGSFKLKVVFDTADGSYGLQEGAVVQVRNAIAGRVGKISPTPDGVMGTTLIIKERFRPFITKNSVAKIKKRFGLAGDAYVEIERGKGGVIVEDGDVIKCVKDEELMETAQKMINEFQQAMQPMLDDIQKIVDSVAGITASIDNGDGLAGAVIKDNGIRDDLASIVSHMESISADANVSVAQVSMLLSNNVSTVQSILNDVELMTGQAGTMLTNQVPQIVNRVPALQDEALSTMRETRRLIEGMQQVWLFRKYIKHDSDVVPLIPAVFCAAADNELTSRLEKGLQKARREDDADAVARNAYNLAVARLAAGDRDAADELNTEARIACRIAGKSPASTYLLQAELARLKRDYSRALSLVREAQRLLTRKDRESRLESRVMLASIYLDSGSVEKAAAEVKRAEHDAKKVKLPQYDAALAGLQAAIAMKNNKLQQAAEWFAGQADSLREAADYGGMTTALRQAADVYSNLGMSASAAEFYYRTAVAVDAAGDAARARKYLGLAEKSAMDAGDKLLLKRIRTLMHKQ